MISHWLSVHSSVLCMSFCPSIFLFQLDNLGKYVSVFSPNLVCPLILYSFGLGLLLGKFHQFLTELTACNMFIFYFQANNLSKAKKN